MNYSYTFSPQEKWPSRNNSITAYIEGENWKVSIKITEHFGWRFPQEGFFGSFQFFFSPRGNNPVIMEHETKVDPSYRYCRVPYSILEGRYVITPSEKVEELVNKQLKNNWSKWMKPKQQNLFKM